MTPGGLLDKRGPCVGEFRLPTRQEQTGQPNLLQAVFLPKSVNFEA